VAGLHGPALLAGAAAALVAASAGCHPTGASDLRRPSDPVVLRGAQLPALGGPPPGEVVAFARSASAWNPIPVQVDERHVANLAVVHNRPADPDSNALVYSDAGTLAGRDPDPALDADDELVFMAQDAGAQAPSGTADPPAVIAGSGVQVAVTDPLTGARGFVYLFRRQPGGSPQPAAGHDYVAYAFDLLTDRNADGDSEYPEDYDFEGRGDPVGDPPANPAPNANPENSTVRASAYSTHFDDRWREDELRVTAGGASGADILDRHKVFPEARRPDATSPGPCYRSENTAAAGHGAFVSNIDGPVRAIRDFLGINSGQYTQRRHVFYARRQDTTTFVRLHPVDEGFDDPFDYSDAAVGMTYRNDRTPGGVTVDGQPDPSVVRGELDWEQVTGPQGTVTHVHEFEIVRNPQRPNAPLPVVGSFYVDDATPLPDFEQCTGDAKAIATSGPALIGPTGDSDPRLRGGPGRDFDLTSHRTQYYDGPNQDRAAAEQRNRWARSPLTVSAAAWAR
jgi:hypothetical protein